MTTHDMVRALSHALVTLETLGPCAMAFPSRLNPGQWTIVAVDRGRAERPELFRLEVTADDWNDEHALARRLSAVGWILHSSTRADPTRIHGWARRDTESNAHSAPITPLFTAPDPDDYEDTTG